MARSRKKNRKPGNSKHWLFWSFQLFVIFSCIVGVYSLWLDFQIRKEFEGKKWSLPARVYANPVDIYPGQTRTLESLEQYLVDLGYEQSRQPAVPGEFNISNGYLTFMSRPVDYWDGREGSRLLGIEFRSGKVSEIRDINLGESLNLFRIEPQLIGKIYPLHNEDRVLVNGDEIPEFLVDALVAVEDRSFYDHHGIDLRGILRAFYTNLRSGEISQGGSTLTQQLVKNFFLTPERTIRRKLNEMGMAMLLEFHYSKTEILAAYINEIYLGQHGARAIHGFGNAAEFYYARPLNELRDDQLATLVALVRGASFYNPRKHPERALKRRDLVLNTLYERGDISKQELDVALDRRLDVVKKPSWTSARYPGFLDLVKRQLLRDYNIDDLRNEGLHIFTTLDVAIQESTQASAAREVSSLEKEKGMENNSLQMAAVIVKTGTGDVLALTSGRDSETLGFNRALDARRPIGSLVKPAIYLTALSSPHSYNMLSKIDDVEISLPQDDGSVWKPRNFDREIHGEVHLYEALRNSYNLASVNLGLGLGLEKVISTIHRTGIKTKISDFPSLLLGSVDLSPFEVTQMYQTFANGGFQLPLNSISEVLDNEARPLQRYGLEVKQELASAPVFILNYMLTDIVSNGTAKAVKTTMSGKLPLAGKTGTTNDMRDSWFAGYGNNLLAVTWLGHDDNRPSEFTGATGALQVWTAMMRSIDVEPLSLTAPEDIAWLKRKNGLFSRNCPDIDFIPYISKFKPDYRRSCFADR